MNAVAIPAKVRILLERFDKQPLSLKSIDFFQQAVDILLEDFPPDHDRWMQPDFEPILIAHARSLLTKLPQMNRSDEALVVAVARLIHQKCFPSVFDAAKSDIKLVDAYETMLSAWQDLAAVALPITGPHAECFRRSFRAT